MAQLLLGVRERAFCLAAFSVERGAELPFAFEEHPSREGPSLYEYRPLVRGFVEEQAPTLRRLPDTRNAIDSDTTSQPIGPMIGSTVNLAQSVSTSFPSITIVPTGMISGTTIYAQTQSPRDFSG